MRTIQYTVSERKLISPFSITGKTFTKIDVLTVHITENGITGKGEGLGIFYFGETGDSIYKDAKSIQSDLEQGVSEEQLQMLLPSGGARNAIDCALWDLKAKSASKSIWQLTGISPSKVISLQTVGVDTPSAMAARALTLQTPQIKVKLDSTNVIERITAVSKARPDATIVIDVNQGWTISELKKYVVPLKQLGVSMIEQPLARDADEELEGFQSPITLCADESCIDTSDLPNVTKRYQMVNIKLDKTGGLTEALKLANQCQLLGLKLMVGNMMGTSLSMAPAYVIAQMCEYADLDGATFIEQDCDYPMIHDSGVISPPTANLWG